MKAILTFLASFVVLALTLAIVRAQDAPKADVKPEVKQSSTMKTWQKAWQFGSGTLPQMVNPDAAFPDFVMPAFPAMPVFPKIPLDGFPTSKAIFKSGSMSTSVSRVNDRYTAMRTENGVTITVTGVITAGAAQVDDIRIQKSGSDEHYTTVNAVPESYRGAVRSMLREAETPPVQFPFGLEDFVP